MKRNLTNVTKDHIIRLKRWVNTVEEGYNYCPFRGNNRMCLDDICYDVFPGLVKGACPCKYYKLEYVERVVKRIIKELS